MAPGSAFFTHTLSLCSETTCLQSLAFCNNFYSHFRGFGRDGCCSVSQKAPRQGQFRETSIPTSGDSSHSSKFSSHLLYSCGPNREQHLSAGVLAFDSEKGNVLFLNAFEYHFFVKCFKYLIMRRCRLCYLVLKLKRKMQCSGPVWTVAHLYIHPARAASFCRLRIEEKVRCHVSLPGPR